MTSAELRPESVNIAGSIYPLLDGRRVRIVRAVRDGAIWFAPLDTAGVDAGPMECAYVSAFTLAVDWPACKAWHAARFPVEGLANVEPQRSSTAVQGGLHAFLSPADDGRAARARA